MAAERAASLGQAGQGAGLSVLSRPCFCQEKLDQMILGVPSKLVFWFCVDAWGALVAPRVTAAFERAGREWMVFTLLDGALLERVHYG